MAIVRPKKKTIGDHVTDIMFNLCAIAVTFMMIYPFWHVLMYSFSESRAAMSGGLFFFPRQFTIRCYEMLLQTKQIYVAFFNSVGKVTVGTAISMTITILTAYALSLPELKGRKFFTMMIYFTMLFSGGMIPHYLLVKDLGLLDKFWVYVIPGAMSAYNMFVLRNMFSRVPRSLSDAAMIDGASHMLILCKIILPLSKPGLATISLYYIRAKWNSYMDGVLYVNSSKLELLQVYLRRLIVSASAKGALSEVGDVSMARDITEESIKMTVIAITVIPVIIVYLFLQKYFAKGQTSGAVKG